MSTPAFSAIPSTLGMIELLAVDSKTVKTATNMELKQLSTAMRTVRIHAEQLRRYCEQFEVQCMEYLYNRDREKKARAGATTPSGIKL